METDACDSEQATGKIRPGVAFEIEHQRLGAALDPDFAAHNTFHAIVNLAANHAVMNAKCHAPNNATPPWNGNEEQFSRSGILRPFPRYGFQSYSTSGEENPRKLCSKEIGAIECERSGLKMILSTLKFGNVDRIILAMRLALSRKNQGNK